jgi:hypothetical protein
LYRWRSDVQSGRLRDDGDSCEHILIIVCVV